jgi:hypothetical protein
MTIRSIAGAAVAVIAAAIIAGSAGAATRTSAALHTCGSVSAGGAAWQVSASSVVSCKSAKSLIKQLGAEPTPPKTNPYYAGLHNGMRCLGGNVSGKRIIDCGGTGGRAVGAVVK